jgi:rhodanese-related sulfurtransferase
MEIGLQEFADAVAAGGLVLDVRETPEYEDGHVPGARLLPLSELEERFAEVPTDVPVYVICAVGQRSLMATQFLRGNGVAGALSVSGGTMGWLRAGGPLTRGLEP